MSTTTTRAAEPAYASRDDCPSWCTEHWWDAVPDREPIFMFHTARVESGSDLGDLEGELRLFSRCHSGEVGTASLGIYDLTPQQCRAAAAALVDLADVLERG